MIKENVMDAVEAELAGSDDSRLVEKEFALL